jgi:hypothetical protein
MKELTRRLIAYNTIRLLMLQVAARQGDAGRGRQTQQLH